MSRWIAAALVLAACHKESPPSEPAEPAEPAPAESTPAEPTETANPDPGAAVIDGVHLGDSYAALMKRAPYDRPCDDDPIDEARTLRAMVYGGTSCRGHQFADGTSVIVFIPFEEPDVFDKPIRSFAWLGGTYFDKRNSLGLAVGATRDAVRARLGEPTSTLKIPGRIPLVVDFHKNAVSAIYDGDQVAGYAVGPMPTELREGDEHWRVVEQMYRRYTARVASPAGAAPAVSPADCEKLLTRVIGLMKADPKRAREAANLEKNRDRAIAQCARKLTPDGLRCGMAAKTFDEFRDCDEAR